MTFSDASYILIQNGGRYMINATFMLRNGGPSDGLTDLWMNVNGTNVPNSARMWDVLATEDVVVMPYTYMYDFNANDILQFQWYSPEPGVEMPTIPSTGDPARPNKPAVMVQVYKVA
jgi:hypothetical protein